MNEQQNYLLPSKASLDVSGAVPFSINVQVFKIPRIYGYVAEHATPMIMRPLPGNKLVYNLLEVSFLVGEDIESWLNIHDWMRGIYAPERTEEYRDKKMFLEQATLTVYSSANNPTFRIKFIDMFPVKLDEVTFDVGETTADPVKTKVEFAFLRYDIEKILQPTV
jgi:hypothetical protein